MNKIKPNCYECQWRGDVPGDAHSCCKHPILDAVVTDPLGGVLAMFASVGRLPPIQAGIDKLGIKANYHGIKKGWFNFPWNFDPRWLEECNGFEAKKKVEYLDKEVMM